MNWENPKVREEVKDILSLLNYIKDCIKEANKILWDVRPITGGKIKQFFSKTFYIHGHIGEFKNDINNYFLF